MLPAAEQVHCSNTGFSQEAVTELCLLRLFLLMSPSIRVGMLAVET